MAKITKAQAEAQLEKNVSKVAVAGLNRIEAALPPLKAARKKLDDEVKSGQSADMLDTLVRQLKLKMKPLAEGIALTDEAVRRLKEAEDDEELFEVAADTIIAGMKELTGPLEKARKEMLGAKTSLTAAEKKLAAHADDSDSAAREWAGFITEFQRKLSGAQKESAAWERHSAEAKAAVERRDKVALERLRKAKPTSDCLDALLAMPESKPFAAFDAEFKWESHPKPLQDQMSVERIKATFEFGKARKLAEKKNALDAQLKALQVQPRDARKAIAALGLPAAALARLQAALDGPASALVKTLEALGKQFKVDTPGKDMVAKLQKAGVL